MITRAQRQEFADNGFTVVRGGVSTDVLRDVSRTIEDAFRKFHPTASPFAPNVLDDPTFHVALRRFRAEHPQHFGLMFDTVQTSVSLWRFGTDPRLVSIAAELMEDEVTGLSATDLLLRMDAPQDTRNVLAWHQDSSYFRQNGHGAHGCGCSVALKSVTHQQGALELLPGSHALGRIDVQKSGGDTAITSDQYRVPDLYTQGRQPISIPLDAGDAIFFNFDLIHRSGTNRSDLFRFTAISRFHRMFTDDFVAGRLVYTPSKVLAPIAVQRPHQYQRYDQEEAL